MTEQSWQTLREVGAEIRRLKARGEWSIPEYERVLAIAHAAVGQETEFLEFILRQKPGPQSIVLG